MTQERLTQELIDELVDEARETFSDKAAEELRAKLEKQMADEAKQA